MNWNWKKMISIVLVVTVCTTGSAIAQAVECDVPQYTFSDENIEIVDPALFYDLFTQENDINAIQDDTLDASYKYTFAPWEDNADKKRCFCGFCSRSKRSTGIRFGYWCG